MGRNWKISKKMSVVAQNTAYVGAIMLMLFVMVIVNMLASSSCSQLMKSIGEKKRTLERLENERERENAHWEEMKTPQNLESALKKHGLAMHYPKPGQIMRMDDKGELLPSQRSVAMEKQRIRNSMTASYRSSRTSRMR